MLLNLQEMFAVTTLSLSTHHGTSVKICHMSVFASLVSGSTIVVHNTGYRNLQTPPPRFISICVCHHSPKILFSLSVLHLDFELTSVSVFYSNRKDTGIIHGQQAIEDETSEAPMEALYLFCLS